MSRNAALETVADALQRAADGIRELMSSPDPDEWVDQTRSPLGRRRHNELARAGALPSAQKLEGKWLVRRREIDAYIAAHAKTPTVAANETSEETEILAYRSPRRARR